MNIQQEMQLMHVMQMEGLLENPVTFHFKGDDISIIMKSDKDSLIAHSDLIKNKDYTYLRLLYVKEESRGKGIGFALMNKLIKDCISNGIDTIELESELVSEGFFKKIGFTKMESEPNNRMILKR